MKEYFVYIMASQKLTLYVGVTNDIQRRVCEHKSKCTPAFTAQYNVTRLLYYETVPDIAVAIAREKQIKSWRREKKVALVCSINPDLIDLAAGW
jgi:putative endonuclease